MATSIIKVDDLDAKTTEDVETCTITFAVGDERGSFEIDLGAENRAAAKEYLVSLRNAGRAVKSAKGEPSTKRTRTSRGDAEKIREWAKAKGYEVSERGRISGEVRAAYTAAKIAETPNA